MKEGFVLLAHVRKISFTHRYKEIVQIKHKEPLKKDLQKAQNDRQFEFNLPCILESHPIIFRASIIILFLALGVYIDLIFVPFYWNNIVSAVCSWLKSTFDLSLIF